MTDFPPPIGQQPVSTEPPPPPTVHEQVLAGLPPPMGQEPVSTEPPRHVRPWWGLGDVVLGGPLILVVALLGAVVALPFVDDKGALAEEDADLPMIVLVSSLLAQQLGQGAWPLVVARWKGLGAIRDWRLRFSAIDLVYGFVAALLAVGLAAVVSIVTSQLVGLTDDAEADNTQFLQDADGTIWLVPLLLAVLVGAPVAEELFFRGLVLRAFEKRLGPVWAVVGSTVVFTLPHYSGAGWAGTTVLLASIAVVGAVLGTVTVLVGRLWPAVFAHVLFNAVGAAAALGLLDQPGAT